MNHPTNDQLLELALDLLDNDRADELRRHFADCQECRARFEKTLEDTELLGSLSVPVKSIPLPVRRARSILLHPLFKAAALMVLGFMGGMAASSAMRAPVINVTPSYLVTATPPDSITRYPVSEATAFAANLR